MVNLRIGSISGHLFYATLGLTLPAFQTRAEKFTLPPGKRGQGENNFALLWKKGLLSALRRRVWVIRV